MSLWPNLTGGEAIDLISRLRGGTANADAYRATKARLQAAFEFDPGKKGRSYSKGNRQKVALIAALATSADLYVLDEPTSGLDPIMETVFNQEIERVAQAGATVLSPATSSPRWSGSAIRSPSSGPARPSSPEPLTSAGT